jgi:hypothetical protein
VSQTHQAINLKSTALLAVKLLLFVGAGRQNRDMSVKLSNTEAKKLMLAAKLKPLETYPGGATPWKCKCLVCGKTVNARLKVVKRGGGGCKFCARVKAGLSNRLSEKEAIKIMKSVGLDPLEPYTSSNKPWKARCKKCKKIVSPHLSLVKSRGSGCAYCAETRVDPQDAVKLFKSVKLKPLIKYPGNKVPWKSIHMPCGREVSPTYLAIKRGQGACKYCAGVALLPKDAEKLFLSKNLKPLEPYSGNGKKPWRSIHIPCGNEVSPTYNVIQQEESIGCHYCSDQFVDPQEAYQFFIEKEFQPLVPYPGSNKPWRSIHLPCGNEAQPSYGKIKSGRRGCAICSNVVKISQERAIEFYRSKGLEPVGKFPGPNTPWKSVHVDCGRTVSPRWGNLNSGFKPCVYCSGARVDMKDVKKLLKELNLKPLEPYPGNKTGWRCIHLPCGNEVSPNYGALQSGQGGCQACGKNMVTEAEALKLLKKNNYMPLAKFPGGSNPWPCTHNVCGSKVDIRAAYLRRGNVGCSFCSGTSPITASKANKLFKSRGFKPLEPFKNARTPMRSIHLVCGREVAPTWGSVRLSGGCKYCSTSLVNLIAPAYLYLITNKELNAHKIGISGHGATVNRLERHKRLGWESYAVLDLDTGEEAYEIEEKILEWLRFDLQLPKYLVSEQMPQGGHTETVDGAEIDLATIWSKVEELSKLKS